MGTEQERPRRRRLSLWLALLALTVVGLILAWRFSRPRPVFNADEVESMKGADLTTATVPAPGVWPQWRGPYRDGRSRETDFLTDWPDQAGAEKLVLWEAEVGPGYSAVVVADGRAYTMFQDGSKEAVVCWQAETGEELWRFRYDANYRNDYGSGPRSTPCVDGDRIYTVGGTGVMHCLKTNPATPRGEVVWRKDLLGEFGADNLRWGVSFSPLVAGDLVYTMPGGPGGNSLAALDKHDGRVVWKNLDDRAGYSSPVYATIAGKEQVVFFTAAGLVSVEPTTGELLWRFPWTTHSGVNAATPIIAGDYVFLSSSYGTGCATVRVRNRDDGTQEPVPVYRNFEMQNHFSSSVLYEGHLYGFNDGRLTCLHLPTGEVKWDAGGYRKGSLLVAAEYLIVLGENGTLALARATPERFEELHSFQIFDNDQCWTVPVLADGLLYARDTEKLFCLDLRRKTSPAAGE